MANNILIDNIKIYDKHNVYQSVISLPDQCLQAWEDCEKIVIPDHYRDIDNVVMCGMGGSGLGARVIESLYFDQISKPIIRVNDYHIPPYVNEKSLVFVSSYSGNTEETVNNLKEALEKNSKIIVVGAGGKLIEIAKEKQLPYYLITPTYNPSNQPRMAIGYSIIGQLVLAAKAGLLNINRSDVDLAVSEMKKIINENDIDTNPEPKSLVDANAMKNKVVFYVSSEHLIGATHIVNNQLNENAKNLSSDFTIPELNHHLMEGLKYPSNNKDNILFYFFRSLLYSDRIRRRFDVTEEVVKNNHIQSLLLNLNSKDKLSQVFEEIQYGAFLNFYLTMLNGIDPAPIPWVDYFKERMG